MVDDDSPIAPKRLVMDKDFGASSSSTFTGSSQDMKLDDTTDKYPIFVFGYTGQEITYESVASLAPKLVECITPIVSMTFIRACKITLTEGKTVKDVTKCIQRLSGVKLNNSKDGKLIGLGEGDSHIIVGMIRDARVKVGTHEFSSYVKYNQSSTSMNDADVGFNRKEQMMAMMSGLLRGYAAHEGLRVPQPTIGLYLLFIHC